MPKYVCIRKCFYKNTLFDEGQVVDFSEKPNHHFEAIEKVKKEKEEAKANEEATVEELRAKLDEMGKAYDMRWGKSRLEQALMIAQKGG